MQQKELQYHQSLKEQYCVILTTILDGLKHFIPASCISHLTDKMQGQIFKLLNMVVTKFFSHLLTLSMSDVTYFTYVLDALGEGVQSM